MEIDFPHTFSFHKKPKQINVTQKKNFYFK